MNDVIEYKHKHTRAHQINKKCAHKKTLFDQGQCAFEHISLLLLFVYCDV